MKAFISSSLLGEQRKEAGTKPPKDSINEAGSLQGTF
jgi:hypothetical protein